MNKSVAISGTEISTVIRRPKRREDHVFICEVEKISFFFLLSVACSVGAREKNKSGISWGVFICRQILFPFTRLFILRG